MTSLVAAAQKDFEVYSGDMVRLSMLFKDKATQEPLDFSSAEFLMELKDREENRKVFALSSGNGLSLEAPGTIRMERVFNVAAGNYMYDLQVIYQDGPVTYLTGVITVIGD